MVIPRENPRREACRDSPAVCHGNVCGQWPKTFQRQSFSGKGHRPEVDALFRGAQRSHTPCAPGSTIVQGRFGQSLGVGLSVFFYSPRQPERLVDAALRKGEAEKDTCASRRARAPWGQQGSLERMIRWQVGLPKYERCRCICRKRDERHLCFKACSACLGDYRCHMGYPCFKGALACLGDYGYLRLFCEESVVIAQAPVLHGW